ncbi:MAG: 4Fe-4S double cluster binding domain-containing protein [Clostridia bacterium]|nr:4Fe-4S double cluster binding domain-containing protein [Clostridia bacterium]
MKDRIVSAALELGFSEAHIVWDDGCAALLLVWGYVPHRLGERIPAYYLASNAMYGARKALQARLDAMGVRVSDAPERLKSLFCRHGIAEECKNGLVSVGAFGTRAVLCALRLEHFDACEVAAPAAAARGNPSCTNCGACARACPGGAISEDGVDYSKCIRARMSGAEHPIELFDVLTTHMGCEVCQAVCPLNAGVGFREPPADVRRAFELERLLAGDTRAARELVGPNKTGNGKLTSEAIAFAAREGGFEPQIAACLDSPFEAVRKVARFALDNPAAR